MTPHANDSLSQTLAAMADPTRRAILLRLAEGEARITQIAEPMEMSLNAVSKHVQVLERAGLVRRDVRGREHFCHLEPQPLREVVSWITANRKFWDDRLDGLEEHLISKDSANNQKV